MNFNNYTKVFKSVSIVSAGTMLNAVFGFVFLTGVAKILSVSDFGKYALLTGLLTLLSRIIDFGTNSLYVADNTNDSTKSKFISVKILLFLLSIPISIITLLLLGFNDFQQILVFCAGLLAYGISYTIYAFYQREQKYIQILILNGVPALIKGLFGILLYLNLVNLNLTAAFAVFSVSIFFGVIVTLFSPVDFGNIKLNFNESLNTVRYAASAGTSQLINESWQTANYLLTKAFNTYNDVGIFSMANKISNIFTLISYSVFTVLLPKNTERKRNNAKYDFKESFILGGFVMILSIIAIFVAEIFLVKAFDNKFAESIKFLDLLIFASAITAVQNFLENYFYVHGKSDYLIKINGTRLILLVVTALIGIPLAGLYFLAVANFIAAFVGLALTYITISKLEKATAI